MAGNRGGKKGERNTAKTTIFEHTSLLHVSIIKSARQTFSFCFPAILFTDQVTFSTSTFIMANTSPTPTQDAKIDADPAGDLVLVVGSGDDQRSIRASSKVLSLASPVLAAMFSPGRFSEGAALSSSNPPEIRLPEDDPDAVAMFCLLVHFREYHGKQRAPSFNQLMNMALFCDKYDAGMALNPWSEVWLQPRSGIEVSGDYRNVLALAYAFNNQEIFWTSSRSMMQYDRADRSEGTRDELLSLLPQDLYGKPEFANSDSFSANSSSFHEASIDQDRNSSLLELSSWFDHLMARFLQDCTRSSSPNSDLTKAGYFFQELYRLNIWPISTRLKTINLGYIQTEIALFRAQENTSFKDKLVCVIARAVDAQKGLCLCCVRKGKVSQGNCHARLRYLCTG